MKIRAALLVSLAALSLAACASLQPYGPQTAPGGQGFSEQRIESNRYRVTYRGVGAAGAVSDWALLRAAELTSQQGYDWFEVVQTWTDGRPGGAGGVRPSVSIGGGSSRWGGYRSSGVGVGVGIDLSGPQPTATTLEVVLGRGPAPERASVYDAREVQAALRP